MIEHRPYNTGSRERPNKYLPAGLVAVYINICYYAGSYEPYCCYCESAKGYLVSSLSRGAPLDVLGEKGTDFGVNKSLRRVLTVGNPSSTWKSEEWEETSPATTDGLGKR